MYSFQFLKDAIKFKIKRLVNMLKSTVIDIDLDLALLA